MLIVFLKDSPTTLLGNGYNVEIYNLYLYKLLAQWLSHRKSLFWAPQNNLGEDGMEMRNKDGPSRPRLLGGFNLTVSDLEY